MRHEPINIARNPECADDSWYASAPVYATGLGRMLNGSGLLAALLSCLLPLAIGIAGGWDFWRSVAYTTLAIIFSILAGSYLLSSEVVEWVSRRMAGYLLVSGLAVAGLQAVSGDPYIQPIGFTVPFVIATLSLPPRRAIATGLFYLGLMVAGLWLSGAQSLMRLALPFAAYGAILFFMFVIIRIALEQDRARRNAARLAEENARLAHDARLSATLAERNRIARELHDTIAQGLTALTMQLEAAQRGFDHDPERARARLSRAHELARATLADVRRSVWALASPIAENEPLEPLLAEYVDQFRRRTDIPAEYAHHGAPLALPSEQAIQVVRILQEGLQNVEKHARATLVRVSSQVDQAGLMLRIVDDGIGFDPALPAGTPQGNGFGLLSLSERARLAGGELQVYSEPGHGATLLLRLPAPQAHPGSTALTEVERA